MKYLLRFILQVLLSFYICHYSPSGLFPTFLLFSLLILYISLKLSFLSFQTEPTCVRVQACGKAIAKASEYKSSTFLYTINPIFPPCSASVCIPSTPPLHVLTVFRHSPTVSLPAKLSFPLPFFSPPSLPLLSPSLPPALHLSLACLPSFRRSSLKLTVPEGRGHLRTKWRISRQLCAHSLRWPSIIHSLLSPPFPFLHLRSALFISPRRLRLYLSVAFSH